MRSHAAIHEATQVGTNLLAYDAKGNLTKDEHQTALAWDPENRLTRAMVTPDASTTGLGAIATYRYDALGRRIAKTVQNRTTLYLDAGAQTVVELDRAALPAQADLNGATADGTLANMAQAPASGGVLPGSGVTRVNFQPATNVVPVGFLADKGKLSAVRTNGLTYGWSADQTALAVARNAVDLPEFDTFVQAQTDTASASWSIALPNGSYPVVVVAGDAASRNQTNSLLIGGTPKDDTTPATTNIAYNAGDFDGYAVQANVSNGVLTIAADPNALHPAFHAKLCFIEIGAIGTTISQATKDKLTALVQRMNTQTAVAPQPVNQTGEYAYGSYVDEVVAYTQTVAGVTKRYYPHYNHLYSVAALTDGTTGAVVERFTYTAYGKQKITDASGNVTRAKSAVGWDRGFTGYIADNESGLLYAPGRMYSPTLGRFVTRDPADYVDGYSLYAAYFVPRYLDPSGMYIEEDYQPNTDVGMPWKNAPLAKGTYGQTTSTTTAECWCEPCGFLSNPDNYCGRMVTCKITSKHSIVLDKTQLPINTNKGKITVDNAYGHEQQHVRSRLAFLKGLKAKYESDTGYCTEPAWCKDEAARIAKEMNAAIGAFNKGETAHTNPGSPPAGTPVPPNGVVPNPTP